MFSKRFFLLFALFFTFPFLFSQDSQPTEEDSIILARNYEKLGDEFFLLLEKIAVAENRDQVQDALSVFIQECQTVCDDIRVQSEAFKGSTLPFRLERAVFRTQGALNRMPELYYGIEPWIGDTEILELWNQFRALFGLGAK